MAKSLRFLVSSSLVFAGLAPVPLWGQATRDEAAQLEFFERKIRPVLINNCYNCHSANTNSKGGLRVDDRNGLLTGGGRGPAIIVGNPDKSLLIQAVKHAHAAVKMPPMKHIADDEIAD